MHKGTKVQILLSLSRQHAAQGSSEIAKSAYRVFLFTAVEQATIPCDATFPLMILSSPFVIALLFWFK